jgi:hypothetical protein
MSSLDKVPLTDFLSMTRVYERDNKQDHEHLKAPNT